MATLVLGAAGAAIGGSIGGAILGVSAATIGGFIGSTIGSVVDSWIISSLAPTQRIEGARLDNLRITSATEGAVIPRLYGRMRIGGNIIWATDFREETKTTTQGGGKGGGGGGKVKTTEYFYYASFAVALCEGPITGIGRIWADGKLLDTAGITWRWYPGDESQTADPFISAKMGAANTPAYRGTAYVVFEDLPLGELRQPHPAAEFRGVPPAGRSGHGGGADAGRHHDPGIGRVRLCHAGHPEGQRRVVRAREPQRADRHRRHGGGAGPAAGHGAEGRERVAGRGLVRRRSARRQLQGAARRRGHRQDRPRRRHGR